MIIYEEILINCSNFKVGLSLLVFFNIIYSRLRRNEIKRAKILIRKIKTEDVFDSITKSCWKSGIQYETLIKNPDMLDIKLKGRKEVVLIRFHKIDMVFSEDYEKFILRMEVNDVKKGIYITTGVFEGKIMKMHRKIFHLHRSVKEVDNFNFIKSQLGLYGSATEVFKNNKLKFFKYLPV